MSFFVALANGAACDSDSNGVYESGLPPSTVFMRASPSSDDYGLAEPTLNGLTVTALDLGTGFHGMEGDVAGGFENGGVIHFESRETTESGDSRLSSLLGFYGMESVRCTSAECADVYAVAAERAGQGSSDGFTDYWIFGTAHTGNPSEATFVFDSSAGLEPLASSGEEALYGHATNRYSGITGPVNPGMEMAEEGYLSERGSEFVSVSDNRLEFRMSRRLGRCIWALVAEE
ncbi:hypothetical protein GF318_03650 [Candidatus Micrarchaeota archaeon]|nr:hypothetical protein [Candidatus Micrarchaeota archaeon]